MMDDENGNIKNKDTVVQKQESSDSADMLSELGNIDDVIDDLKQLDQDLNREAPSLLEQIGRPKIVHMARIESSEAEEDEENLQQRLSCILEDEEIDPTSSNKLPSLQEDAVLLLSSSQQPRKDSDVEMEEVESNSKSAGETPNDQINIQTTNNKSEEIDDTSSNQILNEEFEKVAQSIEEADLQATSTPKPTRSDNTKTKISLKKDRQLTTRPVIIKRRETSDESSDNEDDNHSGVQITEVTHDDEEHPCNVSIPVSDMEAFFLKVVQSRRERSSSPNRSKDDDSQGDINKPQVPPETYLWEELKRWRNKGGYPWTHVDKPPFDEELWKKFMEHEYEPINSPPLTNDINHHDGNKENEVVVVMQHQTPEDIEVEVSLAKADQLGDESDERFLATTPLTNATTNSRTDCDINTSMLDSSGLEDLPLKRSARTKKALQMKTEQMKAQAQGIQQRLRNQAGKLRNKFKSIQRPSFQKNEKPVESERSKLKFMQRPKINLSSLTKRGDSRKRFEFDFKTTKLFSKKSRDRGDYATSSPKLGRNLTPPPPPIQPVARKKGPVGQRWVHRFDDIKYADDRTSELSQQSQYSESLSDFRDRDFAIVEDLDAVRLPPPRAISVKSSISSTEDQRLAGVIEEIDADQFFLRQKGISNENIDMGKYLSKEIREAFREPVVNALRQLDTPQTDEPVIPTRTRSLKRSPNVSSFDDRDADGIKSGYENLNDGETMSVYYKSPEGSAPYYKIPKSQKRRSSEPEETPDNKKQNGWVEVEIENSIEEVIDPPEPLKRRKSKKSIQEVKESDYIIPEAPLPPARKSHSVTKGSISSLPFEEPPKPPKRTSSKSLHQEPEKPLRYEPPRRFRTIPRNFRSVHSLDIQPDDPPKAPVRTRSLSRMNRSRGSTPTALPPPRAEYDDGYAVVDKAKPKRPPPPRRKDFNTFPRLKDTSDAPMRPMRNYSTIGPSRPPRKSKRRNSVEEIMMVDDRGDLQTVEVIEKMKTRPLPAPPRPPRFKSKGEEPSTEEIEEVCVSTQTDPLPDDLCLEDDIMPELSHEQLMLQEEFLQDMRNEEERIQKEMEARRKRFEEEEEERRKRVEEEEKRCKQVQEEEEVKRKQVEQEEAEKEERRKQIEDKESQKRLFDEEKRKKDVEELQQQLTEHDIGYASLDRKLLLEEDGEPSAKPSTSNSVVPSTPIYIPLVPEVLSTERLKVATLDVDHLIVNDLQATNLHVRNVDSPTLTLGNISGNTLNINEVSASSGNLSLGHIDLPPELIQRLLEQLRPMEAASGQVVRSEEVYTQTQGDGSASRRHRKQHRHPNRSMEVSTDEEPLVGRLAQRHRSPRTHTSSLQEDERSTRTVGELSVQLAQACMAATVRQAENFRSNFIFREEADDRVRVLRGVLCAVLLALAGYFLLVGANHRDVHHHHWDFQFPPQPPPPPNIE